MKKTTVTYPVPSSEPFEASAEEVLKHILCMSVYVHAVRYIHIGIRARNTRTHMYARTHTYTHNVCRDIHTHARTHIHIHEYYTAAVLCM